MRGARGNTAVSQPSKSLGSPKFSAIKTMWFMKQVLRTDPHGLSKFHIL